MGIVGFSVDEAEGQAHDGWPDEEENQVPSLSKPKEWQTRMALMRTMLDSHRREAFDAFPPMAGHSSTESVDECKDAGPCWRPKIDRVQMSTSSEMKNCA